MKTNFYKILAALCTFVSILCGHSESLYGQKASELKYYDVRQLGLPVIGRGFENCVRTADQDQARGDGFYTRLPASIEGKVRKAVWDLGQNSSGIAIRFRSDSKCIGAKWHLLNNFGMAHMAATGVKGLDLYALDNGEWKFAGTAQPNGKQSCNVFIRKMDGSMREYLLYLPLYDGVISLEIGIDSTASIQKPANTLLTDNNDPIVFYGTSVTQGGCATRPGMSYTSIIERKLQVPTINLGFSGNGRMDLIMAQEIAKIPARAYVIDCLGNCTAQIIKDSTENFIRTIAEAHPDKPIYMVSNYCYPYHWLDKQFQEDAQKENELWYGFAKKLRAEGFKNIKYIDIYNNCDMRKSATGPDHEATVDGVHLTDLGFLRLAKRLIPYLK